MNFIMPKATVSKGVPKPAGGSASLASLPAARSSALRFPGDRSDDNEKNAIATLRGWVTAQKLVAKAEPLFAYYDPPWTAIPFRSNEIVMRIEKRDGGMRSVRIENSPEKICLACGRPFAWRKKWERDWNNVRFCSNACPMRKPR